MAGDFFTNGEASGLAGMLSMFSAGLSNSNAQSSAANFKAQQLDLNAQLADLQGQSTLEAGDAEAALVNRKAAGTIGQQRAGYAAQGVQVDNGSAAAVQAASSETSALEEQQVRSNAWRSAWGFNVEASNYRSEADMTRLEGQQESTNTLLTAGMGGVDSLMKGLK